MDRHGVRRHYDDTVVLSIDLSTGTALVDRARIWYGFLGFEINLIFTLIAVDETRGLP